MILKYKPPKFNKISTQKNNRLRRSDCFLCHMYSR